MKSDNHVAVIAKSSSRLLVVEGEGDKHVARHVAKRAGLNVSSFDVVARNGVEKLIDSITNEIKVSGRLVVGFVLDANDELDNRWARIKRHFEQASLDLPEKPRSSGTIVDSVPRVGVWLMPDNKSPGELEDFVAQMIPNGDSVWPLAQQYIDRIPEPDRKFAATKTRRAEVYAWLAARENPGPMGAAIGKRDLTTDGMVCRKFSQWLRRLFGE